METITIKKAIKDFKERLIRKAKRIGIWENFGQEEVNILMNDFSDYQYKHDGTWQQIVRFDNWCMNFDDNDLKRV